MNFYKFANFIKSGGGTGGKKLLDVTIAQHGGKSGILGPSIKLPAGSISIFADIVQAGFDQNNAFSYLYPVITPNGLYEKISEGNIEYYEGVMLEGSYPSDPIHQSLGSIKCYDSSTIQDPKLARLTEDQGVMSAGPADGSAPFQLGESLKAGEIYRLLSSYRDHGLEKISFSNNIRHGLTNQESQKYFNGLLGGAKKEYVFLWGNTSKTSGIIESPDIQFAKLKLVFLSLMMSIKQKREGFIYRYPIFDPLNPNASNTKLLQPKYIASQFSFDNLIDSNNQFLEEIGSATGTYQRELYAIAYQLMVGQLDQRTSLLPEGIEKKTFYSAKHRSKIPVSEEVSPILNNLGDLESGDTVADIKPSYNYTIPYFEKVAPQIPEIRLPNIYRSLMVDGIDNFGELYKADLYQENYNQNPQSDDEYSYNDSLYENIANSFIICGETEKSVYENPKYTSMMNIVLDPDFFHNNPILDQADLLKDQLPMYVEVEFETEFRIKNLDTFIKTLADYNVIKHYIQTYIKHGGPKANAASIVDEKTDGSAATVGPAVYAKLVLEDIKKSYEFLDEYGLYHPLSYQYVTKLKDPSEISLFEPDIIRTVLSDSLTTNFGRWFQMYVKTVSDSSSEFALPIPWAIYDTDGKLITKLFDPLNINGKGEHTNHPLEYALYSKTDYVWSGDLDSVNAIESYSLPVVQPEVQQIFEDYTTGYRGHNKMGQSKSVTLFYEIKKFDSKGNNIQNIFVQNKFSNQKVKYIDTQVKYGEKYGYRIIAHKLVFSSEYKIKFENTVVTDNMAANLGYGKKKNLDIVYSAIRDSDGNKVGDYFNSPIFNPFSGPIYAKLGGTGPSTTAIANLLNEVAEQADQIPYEGASIFDSFFDVTGVEQGQDPGETGQIYAIGDPNSGLLGSNAIVTTFSTYRAYTQTDAHPSKADTLFDRDGNDPDNADKKIKIKADEFPNEGEDGVVSDLFVGDDAAPGGSAAPYGMESTGFGYMGLDQSQGSVDIDVNIIDGTAAGFTTEDEPCEIIAPDNIENADANEKLFIFEVKTFPNPIVSKVPYYAESNVVIMDDPPIYPNVNFCPFAKEKRKLMITFENQGGQKEEVPISLMPQDDNIFNAIRLSQKRTYQYKDGTYIDDTLRFKNDDFASEYQVFRITNEPSSYDDFFGQLYKSLNVSQETAYNEMLETNVKYYYVFRTVDKHSKVSNPTPVYQVEMVEDGGLVYPVINIFEMSGKNKLNKVKSFDRFLKVEAAYAQKILNLEKSNIDPSGEFKDNFEPTLGVLDESLWNQKKFKFRIKAKNSCKVIDLNINFVTKHTDTDNGPKTCN